MVVPSLHLEDNSVQEEKSEAKSPVAVVSSRRRASARLQANKQRAEKEELVRKRVELLDDSNGRSAKVCRRRVNVDDEAAEENTVGEVLVSSEGRTENEVVLGNLGGPNGDTGGQSGALTEKSAHARVKETLRLFNKHYLHFVQV